MKDEGDYNFISITRCCRAEKRYEIIINTDSEEHYKATQDFARKLIDHAKPTTNADRIRAMSDEAIAEYVCRNSINTLCDIICGGECNAIATLKKSGDWACKEIVMKWLQQPAEETK